MTIFYVITENNQHYTNTRFLSHVQKHEVDKQLPKKDSLQDTLIR